MTQGALHMKLTGRVVKKSFAAGSKSERAAVFLVTPKREYVLRRRGGNAFRDPELDALVGKSIRCAGTVTGYTLLLDEWKEIEKAS